MPHVTLLYPFVPEPRLAEAADLLRPAAAALEPFDLTLNGFGKFTHSPRSVTLWLRLGPVEPLAALQARLEQAMPWCDDVSGFFGGFTPHLSVGRFQSAGDADRVAERIAATWQPLVFRVSEVALIARSGLPADPYATRALVPLGQSAVPAGEPA
jgi:2'-5' RNA ligase